MGQWSAENATKAYLGTLKMGKRAKEPHISEFISAIAAGNNAQLMVVAACTEAATSSTILLALVAAAHQTGGHVVCILKGLQDLRSLITELGLNFSSEVEFVIGDAERLIADDYKDADFVVVDCKLESHGIILEGMISGKSRRRNGATVLGYNASCCPGSLQRNVGLRTQLLPIGEGLLVTRIVSSDAKFGRKKSNWVVTVDKNTGEEHVFRVKAPYRNHAIED